MDFPDNAERFLFFSKCVAHLARYLQWKPDIVHVNDWHTALVPCLMAHQVKNETWINPPPCCLTIHNLAYQGVFPRNAFALTNLSQDYFNSERLEFYGQLNLLKAGIVFAHTVTTVSPRYAREITTEQYGHGLDGLLRKRQGQLHGILNGVDYEEWRTTHNPFLPAAYSAKDLAGKAVCKQALQREFELPVVADIPLFGAVTRLVEQKGIDITLAALEEMLPSNIQFVLLGSGSPRYEQAFKRLADRFPGKIGVRIGYDQALSHRIEAACDFYVMPSLFEPCGLNQLYSLRYGTVPIVRTTGGLDDTVVDACESAESANGIKFSEFSGTALATAMRKAIALYQAPEALALFRRNGMEADFSWASTIVQYELVYSRMKNGV